MRRLALHASALSDAEYGLYTTSLRDLSLTDEEDEKGGKDGEDAYFENIVVGVREARAWLRGRYSHVSSSVIDGILRLFSPTLAQGDTLSGSEFFAALRLVVHAESGREVDRSLAFVQADPSSASSRPAPQLQPRSTPPSQAPSPAKRYADLPPPAPSRRLPYDMASSKSESGSHNPFAIPDTQSQPHPPPLHPSQRSESSRSVTGSHNPFVTRAPPPPKSEDGNVKLPPLPPRKPPPPIPSSSSSAAPPPPPRRHSRVDRSLSPSKFASPSIARPNGPPPPPPKPPQHVTSTLMRESLHASKIAQSMKRAEEHLEKERVMQVLKSSSSTPSTATFQHASYGYSVRRTASPVRARGYDMSSASSASGSLERGAPPLPRRRHTQQQPSPPMSASSLEQVALAAPPQSGGSYKNDARGKEPTDYTLSPFRSPIDPILTSVPPTTDRPSDGEYSPVRNGPPPTHPDRKPYLGAGYNAPSSFEAIYGGMASPSTPNGNGTTSTDGSPTGRMFRSKSLHHASSPPAHAAPPPVGRRRPESVQVLGTVGSLVQTFSASGSEQGGGGLSRHASLARPAAHRRSSLSVSSTPTRDVSPTRHSVSNASNPGSQSPLSSLQRTFATLQPKLDALAPRLDKARYKAEAGLSRRGFIPSGGGAGPGAGREEKEGLMWPGGGDNPRRGRRGTVGSGRSDKGDPSDDPDVDGAGSEEGDEDTEWQHSRGMRRGLDSESGRGVYSRGGDGGAGQVEADRGRGFASSGRGRNVFDDEYDREGALGGSVGTEQDNLKWPAGEGWKPL